MEWGRRGWRFELVVNSIIRKDHINVISENFIDISMIFEHSEMVGAALVGCSRPQIFLHLLEQSPLLPHSGRLLEVRPLSLQEIKIGDILRF